MKLVPQFKALRDVARPHWMDVIILLQCRGPMAVGDIAKALGMSYMGVKQHCDQMVKQRFLSTWRQPVARGRPRKLHLLTDKARQLFPDVRGELCGDLLHLIVGAYGAGAAQKLLYNYFQQKCEAYARQLHKKEGLEIARSLARIRFNEGYLSEIASREDGGVDIVERHSLLGPIEAIIPAAGRLEEQMIAEIVGTSCLRTVRLAKEDSDEPDEYRFRIG